VEAFDRTYGQTQVLYERAMAGDDLRLAATMLDQQRRILETVVRYASKMGQATMQDIIGHDEEAERAHMEQVRSDLLERLDMLQERHDRGIVRPVSHPDAIPGEGSGCEADAAGAASTQP
jgi:hypothetical protein